MREALIALVYSIASAYALWGAYVLIMNIKRARDAGTLSRVAYVLGVPILIIGYLLDFIVNVGPCTVLFLEPPRETTVTARLKRHRDADNWRGRLARWMAAHLLDPFDPDGRHV